MYNKLLKIYVRLNRCIILPLHTTPMNLKYNESQFFEWIYRECTLKIADWRK